MQYTFAKAQMLSNVVHSISFLKSMFPNTISSAVTDFKISQKNCDLGLQVTTDGLDKNMLAPLLEKEVQFFLLHSDNEFQYYML